MVEPLVEWKDEQRAAVMVSHSVEKWVTKMVDPMDETRVE
jgi:hypothetical protein